MNVQRREIFKKRNYERNLLALIDISNRTLELQDVPVYVLQYADGDGVSREQEVIILPGCNLVTTGNVVLVN